MKYTYTVILALALLLVCGCGQRVNDPADEGAIRNLMTEYEKASNSRELDWFSASFYTDDAILLPPNQPPTAGKEAIAASTQATFDQFASSSEAVTVEEVLSSRDLAVARGGYDWKAQPKAEGLGEVSEQGKWSGTFRRQGDGSWKCSRLTWNSSLPAPGATPQGVDEQALLQLEREWGEAAVKADVDTLGRILGNDYAGNYEGQVTTRAQLLANLRRGVLKIESAALSDMKAMVFGDRAVVQGVSTVKSSERGRDTSGKYFWTDVFVKREGRWQCVANYAAGME